MIDTIDVFRTAVSDIEAFSVQVPVPESHWRSLRIDGKVVPFEP